MEVDDGGATIINIFKARFEHIDTLTNQRPHLINIKAKLIDSSFPVTKSLEHYCTSR